MSAKQLNLKKSVQELCSSFPELPEILKDLGFTDIVKPGMLQTAGRFMTIPRGAKVKKIALENIVATLEKEGFTVTGLD